MCTHSNINILHSLHSVLLFLVLAGNSALFRILHSYTLLLYRLFLCALEGSYSSICVACSGCTVGECLSLASLPGSIMYVLGIVDATITLAG